jgi:hypothetical protein
MKDLKIPKAAEPLGDPAEQFYFARVVGASAFMYRCVSIVFASVSVVTGVRYGTHPTA